MENAFKHSKLVQEAPVSIFIQITLEDDLFSFTLKNNYNNGSKPSPNGIGLTNVKRRLDVLYPNGLHQLVMHKDEIYYTTSLQLKLVKAA
jgi:LytS/YehU family sensor histidine kinase